ncbi:MAG: DUF192 domain-containing protein [bacterium]|nr:DUF192 domain-containing protein [bacterium]
MQLRSFGVVGVVFGMLLAFVWLVLRARPQASTETPMITLNVGSVIVQAEIADTPARKARGLSGRASLADGSGMLFPFAPVQRPTFWMKDMLIPLDLVWIRGGKVTEITSNVPPPSGSGALPLYRPAAGVDAVLEVAAGFAERAGVAVGDTVRQAPVP